MQHCGRAPQGRRVRAARAPAVSRRWLHPVRARRRDRARDRPRDRPVALRARPGRGHRVPADDALRERLLRLRRRSRERDTDGVVGRQPRARRRRAAAPRRADRRARARRDRRRARRRARVRGRRLDRARARSRSLVLAWEYSAPPLRLCATRPRRARHRGRGHRPRAGRSASTCRRPISSALGMLALAHRAARAAPVRDAARDRVPRRRRRRRDRQAHARRPARRARARRGSTPRSPPRRTLWLPIASRCGLPARVACVRRAARADRGVADRADRRASRSGCATSG